MTVNVKNLELNANTVKTIAQRVLKDKNMRITDKFVPVISDYTVHINQNRRVKLVLSEDTFLCMAQAKKNNEWTDMKSGCFGFHGPFEAVEDIFFQTVSALSKFITK